MVKYSQDRIDSTLHALSDCTRREMLRLLSCRPRTVSELAEPFDISFAGVSKHLRVLERAKLVKKTKIGRTYNCVITPDPVREAFKELDFVAKFWSQSLDNLEQFLTDDGGKACGTGKKEMSFGRNKKNDSRKPR